MLDQKKSICYLNFWIFCASATFRSLDWSLKRTTLPWWYMRSYVLFLDLGEVVSMNEYDACARPKSACVTRGSSPILKSVLRIQKRDPWTERLKRPKMTTALCKRRRRRDPCCSGEEQEDQGSPVVLLLVIVLFLACNVTSLLVSIFEMLKVWVIFCWFPFSSAFRYGSYGWIAGSDFSFSPLNFKRGCFSGSIISISSIYDKGVANIIAYVFSWCPN